MALVKSSNIAARPSRARAPLPEPGPEGPAVPRRIERAKTLLRDTDLPVTQIAFQTGWESLGAFGRTFRDITGESPRQLRAREQAASHELERVPACYLNAADRPDLRMAVSEKRLRDAALIDGTEPTEVP